MKENEKRASCEKGEATAILAPKGEASKSETSSESLATAELAGLQSVTDRLDVLVELMRKAIPALKSGLEEINDEPDAHIRGKAVSPGLKSWKDKIKSANENERLSVFNEIL